MKRIWPLLLLFLTLAPLAHAQDDSDTIYPLSNLNPALTTYGGTAYPQQLYDSIAKEAAGRYVENGFLNYVYSGCLGTTGAGLTMTPSACIGYNAGYRAADATNGAVGFTSQIIFSDSSVTWVAMDENRTGNNAGLVHFTRVANTHYLIDSLDASKPTMAVDSQLLMQVTTSGGAITVVVDKRNLTPPGGNSNTLPGTSTFTNVFNCALPPYSAKGNGTALDLSALQACVNAGCSVPGSAVYLPTPPACYNIANAGYSAGLTVPCALNLMGSGWGGTSWGAAFGEAGYANTGAGSTFAKGSVICSNQTSGRAVTLVPQGQEGGNLKDIFVVGPGVNGATINISSIADVATSNHGLVTVTLATPHGIPTPSATNSGTTGLIIAGANPTYPMTGCTQPSGTYAICTTTAPSGITVPTQNISQTVSGVTGETRYNQTAIKLVMAGPCSAGPSCGINGQFFNASTHTSTTLNDVTDAPFLVGQVGLPIQVVGGGPAGATLTTTIASFNSSTEVILNNATSNTANGVHIIIYQALTNEQFEYDAGISGLGVGTSGNVAQVGYGPGGDTNNYAVVAQAISPTALQFWTPFVGLGTMATGTATLTTIGLGIGDGWAAGNNGYASGFNTSHVGVGNFGINASIYEQNATHDTLSLDGPADTNLIDDSNFANGSSNALLFKGMKAAGGALRNVVFILGGEGNVWDTGDFENPIHNTVRAAQFVLADLNHDTLRSNYIEGGGSGNNFIGDSISVFGVVNQQGLELDNNNINQPAAAYDYHLYAGTGTYMHGNRFHSLKQIDAPANQTLYYQNDYGAGGDVVDNGANSFFFDNGLGYANMGVFGSTSLQRFTITQGLTITGGNLPVGLDLPGEMFKKDAGITVPGMYWDGTDLKIGEGSIAHLVINPPITQVVSLMISTSTCPFTLATTSTIEQACSATIVNLGDKLTFPQGGSGTFEIDPTGQDACVFRVNGVGSAPILVSSTTGNCSASQNNPSTVNFYYDGAANYIYQNELAGNLSTNVYWRSF